MKLFIDTSDRKHIVVALKVGADFEAKLEDENEFGSQVLLPLIERLLKENKLEYSDLRAIEVNTGPGSFTGLKVGVSVANALGFSLGIPVNGKKIETNLAY